MRISGDSGGRSVPVMFLHACFGWIAIPKSPLHRQSRSVRGPSIVVARITVLKLEFSKVTRLSSPHNDFGRSQSLSCASDCNCTWTQKKRRLFRFLDRSRSAARAGGFGGFGGFSITVAPEIAVHFPP